VADLGKSARAVTSLVEAAIVQLAERGRVLADDQPKTMVGLARAPR
jgi:hypothetical protein